MICSLLKTGWAERQQSRHTGMQFHFDVANSRSLPEEVRIRLISLAGNRITEGCLSNGR
ncbi:hypothetical protein ACFLTP_06995 [Chloroflexota bacterium]